jgi:drug/metabolite transporter (DMT)-like permease
MMHNISLKTKFSLIVAVVLWASAFVGIRAGLHGYSPGGLALLRFITASFCMFIIYNQFAKKCVIPLKDKLLLLAAGAVGAGWYNITLNYGEVSVPSGVSSFIISQSPLLTCLFAVFFLSERFSGLSFIGMVISLFGVLLISVGQTHGFHLDIDLLYLFLATIINASYSILQKPFLKKYPAINVTAYIIWGGALMLLIFTPNLIHDLKTTSLNATLSGIYLGIFPAAMAYLAWSYALTEISASRAVSFLYFMPIIATLLGWLWLGEMPAMISLIGGFIALFGVWLVNQSYHRLKETASLPAYK